VVADDQVMCEARVVSQRYVAITLVFLAIAAVGTDVSRLEAPQGDRYVNYMTHWPSDFRAGLEATRAWLAGLDPYLQALPDAVASDHFVVDGTTYRFCYPPTHLLLYVPLALSVRNNETAGHIWFHIMLLSLLGLSLIVWSVSNAVTSTPPASVALGFVLLAIQPGTLLALERVQSDTVISVLSWTAVVLLSRGRFGWALFSAIAAALLKPYAILFAAGIFAIGLAERDWRPTIVASAVALGALFAPVAKYLPESIRAVRPRSDWFWASWQNWSLTDVSYAIHPQFMGAGRILFFTVCFVVSLICWINLRHALRVADARRRALWLTLFAICSLETVIGASKTSFNYAMVMLLPGLLVVAQSQPYLFETFTQTSRGRIALNAWLTSMLVGFWLARPWWQIPKFPIAGFAILALVITIGCAGVEQIRRRRGVARPSPQA
jgi:hypothetical protein